MVRNIITMRNFSICFIIFLRIAYLVNHSHKGTKIIYFWLCVAGLAEMSAKLSAIAPHHPTKMTRNHIKKPIFAAIAVQSKAKKLTRIFTHSRILKEKIPAISRGNAVITPKLKNANITNKVDLTGELAALSILKPVCIHIHRTKTPVLKNHAANTATTPESEKHLRLFCAIAPTSSGGSGSFSIRKPRISMPSEQLSLYRTLNNTRENAKHQ